MSAFLCAGYVAKVQSDEAKQHVKGFLVAPQLDTTKAALPPSFLLFGPQFCERRSVGVLELTVFLPACCCSFVRKCDAQVKRRHEAQAKAHLQKASLEVAHPGVSFNPDKDAQQELLRKVP